MRTSTHVRSIILLLLILFLTACSGGLFGDWQIDKDEICRVSSPNGIFDALIVEGNGGATTGYSYYVYVVKSGTVFEGKSNVFDIKRATLIADHIEDLKLAWSGKDVLDITYKSARIFHFTNFEEVTDSDQKTHECNVRLIELSE